MPYSSWEGDEMGLLKLLALAVSVFLIVELLMLAGFHVFLNPLFISETGMFAFFCFLVVEMAFVTFK